MTLFPQAGDLLRVRSETWRVLHVARYEECAIVELTGAADTNRGITARFVLPFEPVDPIPPARDTPRVVGRAAWRRLARAALTSTTPAWTSLRAAAHARLTLLPYQLEPALALASGRACRFLLADEVGLGKTIQAGLLIAELLVRERDARVLIVTPAGLRDQWRDELRARFDIEAEILDAPRLACATAGLPSGVNPWAVPQVVLTSIDFVKRADVIRALEPLVWDLVAFDEAHAVSGRSDRATAAEQIARRGRRVVAITATPHSGEPRAFARLCALGRLEEDDPMLLFRRSRLEAGVRGSRSLRMLQVRPTRDESAVHRSLEAYARRVWQDAPAPSAAAARLAMIVLARRACSSPASLVRSVDRRLALLGSSPRELDVQLQLPLDEGMVDEDQEPDDELAAPGFADFDIERRCLERIRMLAETATARESKIAALVRLLRRAAEPAIVFTEYRDTLERVARVVAVPEALARLHGGMSAAERMREARRFTHGDARVLVATDAASEGLNLHHRCRLVINLEVPWTPLRLEQRIGRVDRLGQQRRVHAIGLVGRGTAEETVVDALLARAAVAAIEAPFGSIGVASPADLVTVNLRDDAIAEAVRLETWRALSQPLSPHVRRPAVSILNRLPRRVFWAFRITFVDAADVVLWETIVAPTAVCDGFHGQHAKEVRAWFAHLQASYNPELFAGAAHAHAAALRRLRRDVGAAVPRLVAREHAILRVVRESGGRLAAPLAQPGLFDRRAVRDQAAQRQLAEEAAAAAAARIVALQRLSDPIVGEARLIFAVAV